jgi:hypothetical protein
MHLVLSEQANRDYGWHRTVQMEVHFPDLWDRILAKQKGIKDDTWIETKEWTLFCWFLLTQVRYNDICQKQAILYTSKSDYLRQDSRENDMSNLFARTS